VTRGSCGSGTGTDRSVDSCELASKGANNLRSTSWQAWHAGRAAMRLMDECAMDLAGGVVVLWCHTPLTSRPAG
jgi:hypothetical protein